MNPPPTEPQPAAARVPVPPGGPVSRALADSGHPLNTRCGQRGLCHGCEVRLVSGAARVGDAPVPNGAFFRSCQAVADTPLLVDIPARSLDHAALAVCDSWTLNTPLRLLPHPSWQRIGADTVLAVDIGTTTVALAAADPVTGQILARAGRGNAQRRFGDNVLTRIEAAARPGAVREMQTALFLETLAPLLEAVCSAAALDPARFAGIAIAGNTTMLHLLMGHDPTPLGRMPFTPGFLSPVRTNLRDLHLPAHPHLPGDLPLLLLPGLSAYVGADIVADILATGMAYDSRPSLLADVGTNGEIVLWDGARFWGCATAAGPAFEGSRLRYGSRARPGAIAAVDLDSRHTPALRLIGDGSGGARGICGICGSAYIDFLAEARRTGLLTSTGRFDPAIWNSLPPRLRGEDDGDLLFLLGGPEAAVSEPDIASLLQAKAAIAAGIDILLECAGLQPGDLGAIYLAGGFGQNLHPAKAVGCGLLPSLPVDRIQAVGNTALAGAMAAALDAEAVDIMETYRAQTTIVELNLHPGFEDRYIDHLALP